MPDVVFRSPMRDALLQYSYMMREDAIEQFRHEQALYVANGLKTPPKLPEWLKNVR